MAKKALPVTLEELRAEAKKNKVLTKSNGQFIDQISQLSRRQQKLALLLLTRPDLSDNAKVRMAGFNLKKEAKASAFIAKVEGKLGDVLLQLKFSQLDMAKAIKEQLNAMTSHVFREPVYDSEGRKIDMKTVIVETPDNATRNRMINTLLRLGNYFPPKEHKVKSEHTHTLRGSIDLLKRRNEAIEAGQPVPADFEVIKDGDAPD